MWFSNNEEKIHTVFTTFKTEIDTIIYLSTKSASLATRKKIRTLEQKHRTKLKANSLVQ